MPEISLKAYFAKLNNLLGVNSADEVVQHSRHILQSYPKNVTAYRFLGRALVLSGRWEEGREALRRVLSVYPDDYIAHLGLSEANEHLDHADEAIWHLERAYEQNSNNRDVIEALRNLYRRYRNVENLKMQLTSAAVARQNLRSKDYAQAIDTLRSARAKMNDRLDLKLLLAQVLWEQGSHEEAAEIAIEVLKVLPDCLEANRVMAQLWLSMGRPSDAQRYVNHLEAVDPYLAVEVAQGYAPDDDVFRLDELDYVRTSQSELASARPDWLSEIGSTPMPVLENEVEQGRDDWSSLLLGTRSPADAPVAVEPGPLSRFTEITPQPEPKRTGGLTDLFGDALAAPADELKSLFERSTGSLDDDPPGEQNLLRRATSRVEPESTGGLTDLFGDALAPHTDDLSSLFGKAPGSFGDDEGGDDDRLAWMRDAGIEMVDDDDMQPDFNSLLADDDSELPQFDASPMAWLEDHNSDMIREEDALEQGSATAGVASSDELLSWMQQEDDFAAASGQPAYNAAALEADADEEEAFDWLQNDPLLDGASKSEGQLTTEGASLPDDDFAAFSATGTDWQNDMFEQAQAPKPDTGEPAAPGGRRGLTAILQDGNFDWVNTEKTEVAGADAEMDDWLNQFGPAQPRTASTDSPDWLSDIGFSGESSPGAATPSSESDEWFEQEEPERLSPAAMANVSQFAMMNTDNSDDEEGDWLSALPDNEDEEAAPEADEDDEAAFEWGGDAATAETDVDTGALPDWLNDYVPAEAQPGMSASVAQIDWGAGVSATEPDEDSALSDWLSELEPEDEDAAETPASSSAVSWTEEAEETDWLAELQPASGEQGASGGDASWLAELGAVASDEDDVAAEAVSSDDMSWLSEIAPEAETEPEAAPVASDDMSWLAELEPEADAEPEPAAEAVSSDDMGWLSELAPEAETEPEPAAEPVASDDMGWLSELAPEVDTGVNEQPAAVSADEDMSWLSDLGVGAETLVGDVPAEPVASGDDDWLTELEDASAAVPEAEPVSGDDMGWLAELEPASPAEPETATSEASAVNLEDFPWMSDDADDALAEEAAEPVAADDAAWLSELAPDEEQLPPITLQPAAPGDLEWLAELDEATEQPAVNVEDFPWMAEEADDAVAEQPIAEPAAAEAEMDWLAELEPEADTGVSEEPVAVNADEEMSWLSELEPTSEPQTEAAQELAAAVTSEADEWLSDEPAAEEDATLETPAAEIPDWLAELEPESSEEAEPAAESAPEPVSEDDWLEADEPEAAAVAAEMPSWLADLEPEAADEPEAEEAVAAAAATGAGLAAFAALDDDEPDAEADEFAPDEEVLEPTPATNAPDWLNAMVPGLDVDYEAAEDETLFVDDEDSYDADEREYAWVEDIVEEEMAAVEGAGGYTFTRPPAWFASLGGSQEGGKTEDDFPDWISDDSDLPDYLR